MSEITVPLRAPELAPGRWLRGPEVSLAFARGAVVLVEFWEATCVHCLRVLPFLRDLHRRYADRGLVMVGVHTPEFELSRDPAVVEAVAGAERIPYPVLLDDGGETWSRFANHYWPARYLIDARGYLRYEHFGEGAYGETERFLQKLLREAGDTAPMPELLAPRDPARPAADRRPTREIQAGYHRGKLLSAEGYRPGEVVRHRRRMGAPPPPEGAFAARGRWRHAAEYLEVAQAGAEVELVVEAAGVHAVLAPAGELEIEELEVGKPDGAPAPRMVRWRGAGMVTLLDAPRSARRHLRLRFPTAGTRLYSLSFTGEAAIYCAREETP